MYDSHAKALKTGDVVKLTLLDFQHILRHQSILHVIEQFSSDPKYSAGLWTVLNKPCDMVHSANQRFKHNLFLCPLQGLLSALKDGPFDDCLHATSSKTPLAAFKKAFADYKRGQTKEQYPRTTEVSFPEYNKNLESLVKPAIEKVTELLGQLATQDDDPAGILSDLKKAVKKSPLLYQDLNIFGASDEFQQVIDAHKKNLQRSNAIIIASSKHDKIADLCLNQFDSQGVFFYEPHQKLWRHSKDLAHIIKLEEMLTLKIKPELRENGDIVHLLNSRRVIGLTENFSDRLQNIMGNYYSKIGTDDVSSSPIMELYHRFFPKKFFWTSADYEKRGLAPHF